MTDTFSIQTYRPWLYFALTFIWSWVCLLPPVFLGLTAEDFPVTILRGLAGAGPMLVTLFLLFTRTPPVVQRDYWARLLSIGSINPITWLVILLSPIAILAAAGAADRLLGGSGLMLEAAADLVDKPLQVVPFALFILAFGPIPEEMGWRGYALPGLQADWTPLKASLVLGVIWAIWHLPLFFIPGTYQAGLGVFTPAFWWFMLGIIPETIMITWVFNRSRGSTLSAVIYHFAINFTGELFMLSPRGDSIGFLLWVAGAVLVSLI